MTFKGRLCVVNTNCQSRELRRPSKNI
uniref:Uncharacterized protein n=1 Tax=Arundo donax TaxID=35708 RepID=A0A0A9AKJ3_ARUDO